MYGIIIKLILRENIAFKENFHKRANHVKLFTKILFSLVMDKYIKFQEI